ncbi:hypothetical protein D4R89_01980 [bacterium]|nr:MAG: hypothetical protein D4R89_01980 [bacterium]
MNTKALRPRPLRRARGFTLIELLVGSGLMLFVIIAALSVYSKSNQISVDQQQYTEIQHDVRSAMYLVMRDTRMAGSALPEQFNMYAIDGVDNEGTGEVRPDRLILMGNMDDPLLLQINTFSETVPATPLSLADGSFEQYPYLYADYVDRIILILPNPAAACRHGQVRKISAITQPSGGVNETLQTSNLLSTINLPSSRRLISTERLLGTLCGDTTNYHGGTVMFLDVKEYWLDLTGTVMPAANGYIGGGVGGVLYQTKNGVHNPVAQNIENFQVEYNGDINLPVDGLLDGFVPWNSLWTLTQVSCIRQVRVLILGRTANPFVSVSGRPTGNIRLYRRPGLSNSLGATTDDRRRRFLLESTSNIRNLSLNIYNRGVR